MPLRHRLRYQRHRRVPGWGAAATLHPWQRSVGGAGVAAARGVANAGSLGEQDADALSRSLCRPGHRLRSGDPAERACRHDIASISRQLGYIPKPRVQENILAVPEAARCAHGFPQAFVYHPLGDKPSSGGCRLSCPLLVSVVDRLEIDGGGLRHFRRRLKASRTWRSRLHATNVAHAAHRCSAVTQTEAAAAREALGAEFTAKLLTNGVAGMSINEPDDETRTHDAKCLHAQLADWLCRVRGGHGDPVHIDPAKARWVGRAVAAAAAEAVRDSASGDGGIGSGTARLHLPEQEMGEEEWPLDGLRGEGLRCWTACDPAHVAQAGDFVYEPQHNQIKLMHRRRRRNAAKQQA